MTDLNAMVERAAKAIAARLDSNCRPDTPYGWRRAIDKGSYEVYFLDYQEWREVIDEATIVARYAKQDEAEDHAIRLQTEYVASAALSKALDPHDSKLQDIILGAMGFYRGDDFGLMARVQAHDAIAALRAAWLSAIHGHG